MHLKSITLKGFKSFPDRTRLEFGPGVSVIVGPNGSGKSNVTDAVLWALGEQSPAAVRGSSMQDVIFGGVPGRQGASNAEVELVLDDSDGALGLGVPEVSIVRRLDRAGEGEYRLAGARCRLVDVIDVLSDTGLGKEMHSVISQGRVESLVTSKPRDRRLLIEEAAGLGKHRKRRRRAQLKLERTRQNLDRALDIEREARSRLRPLKRQAEAADLHARLERQTLEARWELARDDLRIRREELGASAAAVEAVRSRRGEVERELKALAARREAAEEALAARSAQREELSRRCFAAQSAAERVSYRTEAVVGAAAAIEERAARITRLLDGLRGEQDGEGDDQGAKERIAALENALSALEREQENEVAAELAELERRRAEAGSTLSARDDAVSVVARERDRVEAEAEQARGELRAAERAVEASRREAARVGAELASVNQFLRTQARLPGGSPALSGAPALSDELDVEPGYELAVSAALDGRLRAAVVADRRDGMRLLDVAGADGGRVLVRTADDSPPPSDGAGDRLSDHVRGDGEAAILARALLCDTWVFDSLEGLADDFRGMAVTRAGRVWAPGAYELRQAPALGEERVLAERNRREGLMRSSASAVTAEREAAAALERAQALVSERDAERERVLAASRAAIRERDEAAEEERRLALALERRRSAPDEGPAAARRAQLAAELAAEQRTIERAQRDRAERERRVGALEKALHGDRQALPEIKRLIESLTGLGPAINEQRARFDQALSVDREAGERLALELRSCAQGEASVQAQLQRENESLTGAEVQAQRARDQAAEAEEELRALASRLALKAEPADEELDDERRHWVLQRIERLGRRREQLGPVNPLAQEEYVEAVAHVEELEGQREDLEAALHELEQLIGDTDRQIREAFEQTFGAAARNFEELVPKLFPNGRGRLRLVRERDTAPRTLGGQDEQLAELDDQATDDASEDEILGVEIEITPAGKDTQRLSLLSGGEKSMTAMAFLFAVFLARPCPFYILDEVEAALDDLNIDRFLDLLRVYSRRAQFIVVTHQKRTMEAADSLYGVSMGADGISKVISRRLPAEAAA